MLIQNCIYLKIVMHLVMQYTPSIYLHNIKHVLNQERDYTDLLRKTKIMQIPFTSLKKIN